MKIKQYRVGDRFNDRRGHYFEVTEVLGGNRSGHWPNYRGFYSYNQTYQLWGPYLDGLGKYVGNFSKAGNVQSLYSKLTS